MIHIIHHNIPYRIHTIHLKLYTLHLSHLSHLDPQCTHLYPGGCGVDVGEAGLKVQAVPKHGLGQHRACGAQAWPGAAQGMWWPWGSTGHVVTMGQHRACGDHGAAQGMSWVEGYRAVHPSQHRPHLSSAVLGYPIHAPMLPRYGPPHYLHRRHCCVCCRSHGCGRLVEGICMLHIGHDLHACQGAPMHADRASLGGGY